VKWTCRFDGETRNSYIIFVGKLLESSHMEDQVGNYIKICIRKYIVRMWIVWNSGSDGRLCYKWCQTSRIQSQEFHWLVCVCCSLLSVCRARQGVTAHIIFTFVVLIFQWKQYELWDGSLTRCWL